jgi:hypothetical protein
LPSGIGVTGSRGKSGDDTSVLSSSLSGVAERCSFRCVLEATREDNFDDTLLPAVALDVDLVTLCTVEEEPLWDSETTRRVDEIGPAFFGPPSSVEPDRVRAAAKCPEMDSGGPDSTTRHALASLVGLSSNDEMGFEQCVAFACSIDLGDIAEDDLVLISRFSPSFPPFSSLRASKRRDDVATG